MFSTETELLILDKMNTPVRMYKPISPVQYVTSGMYILIYAIYRESVIWDQIGNVVWIGLVGRTQA